MTGEARVLVVGAGPAGLAAAIELADRGVDALVVERRALTAVNHPRATAISQDTMDVVSRWGLEGRVRAAGFASDYVMSIRPSLVDAEIARIPFPDHVWTCAQDHLEAIIGERAAAAGAIVRYQTELVALTPADDGVAATIRDVTSRVEQDLRVDYVVGADGAHGVVRKLAGIRQSRLREFGDWMSILFHAPVRKYVDEPPCLVYGIGDSAASGIVCPTDGGDRWIRGIRWQPGLGEQRSDYTEARCSSIVRDAIGVADLPVTITHVQPFRMTAALADAYHAGRVVLAGDAAHVFPPSSGMGMNIALGDGVDVGGRLAELVCGEGGSDLLETYEVERRAAAMQHLARDLDGAEPEPVVS